MFLYFYFTVEGVDFVKLLEEKILKDGHVGQGNVLKVDSFLNHQMDIHLFDENNTVY